MNLRPHHILCIQKFTGHGYDDAFTEHMTSVVAVLKEKPETQITITKGCDELCGVCPHNAEGVCTSLEKVSVMDGSVLEICGLSYGKNVPWSEISKTAREKIFLTDAFGAVCCSCEWFEIFKNTKSGFLTNKTAFHE